MKKSAIYGSKYGLFDKRLSDNLFVSLYMDKVGKKYPFPDDMSSGKAYGHKAVFIRLYPNKKHTPITALKNVMMSLVRTFIDKGRAAFVVNVPLFIFVRLTNNCRQTVSDFDFRKNSDGYPFFKYASDYIWFLGKNNIDSFGACR